MPIKLTCCSICRKPKQNVQNVQITMLNDKVINGYACIECIGSGQEVFRAIKKLSQEEKEKLLSYVLENIGRFKK